MLYSQARSKRFIRRTQYWDAKNREYAKFNKIGLIHSFEELEPIEEHSTAAFPVQNQGRVAPFSQEDMGTIVRIQEKGETAHFAKDILGTRCVPKCRSDPPPTTVGKVTSRHPSTTVEGKLPANTFYRRKDGRLSLSNTPQKQKLNLIKTRKVALLKKKGEETGCAIHLKVKPKAKAKAKDGKGERTRGITNEIGNLSVEMKKKQNKQEKEKKSIGGRSSVRTWARKMVRRWSDRRTLPQKTSGAEKFGKSHQHVRATSISDNEKLGKTAEFPGPRSYDVEYPADFDEVETGNCSLIIRESSSEFNSFETELEKGINNSKKKAKKAEAADRGTQGLHNEKKPCEATENTHHEKKHLRGLSLCDRGSFIGNPALSVTYHDPPAKPIMMRTEQYPRDSGKKTHKQQKEQKKLVPRFVKCAVRRTRFEPVWSFLSEGSMKCCQAAWQGTQCRGHDMVKRIGQAKQALTSDSIKRSNKRLLNSDGRDRALELRKDCVYYRRETQPGLIIKL